MTTSFSRRGVPRRPRPVAPPRVGHFYLNLADRRLFCLNETARQLLRDGVPINPADQERQPLLHLDGEPAASMDLPLQTAWRERRGCEASFLWPRPGGVVEVLSWCAAPLLGSAGEVVGVSATVVLGAHEPDWEELAGLAHDLRTPLQALRLLVPIVQTMPRPEVMTDVLQRLRGAADRAMAIAQDLLNWCKGPVEASRRASSDWLPLEPLLRGLVLEQETTARAKGIAMEMDLSATGGLAIKSHRVRLGRLIDNLLGNAVRYTAAGRVRLATAWRAGVGDGESCLVIAVEDTGVGMTEEEQDSIFEPFLRGKAGMADNDSGGSGIGLATVDRLVGELGLALEVSSQPGKGSRFELLVPRHMVRPEG
ncbi:MAG: HAMP domain-containing sensor histidine kinase [Gemmataceae bacterium]